MSKAPIPGLKLPGTKMPAIAITPKASPDPGTDSTSPPPASSTDSSRLYDGTTVLNAKLPLVCLDAQYDQYIEQEAWAPWPDDMPPAEGPIYLMRLPNSNKAVHVWSLSSNIKLPEQWRYFCHGWGLSTFNRDTMSGYTITSTDCCFVLSDPMLFTPVITITSGSLVPAHRGLAESSTPKQLDDPSFDANARRDLFDIQQGDIIALFGEARSDDRANRYKAGDVLCLHTAIIVKPVLEVQQPAHSSQKQVIISDSTVLSSKNGTAEFLGNTTLEEVKAAYRGVSLLAVYRRNPNASTVSTLSNASKEEAVKREIELREAVKQGRTAVGKV